MKRRVLVVVLGIVALPVLWLAFGHPLSSATPFDSKVWKKEGSWQSDVYPRLSMADDLIRRDTLKGLTKAQVLDMLGDPGDHGYFSEYDLVYWLGPERSFISIDSEWLAITLNKTTGLVEGYELLKD